jgi:hypothetical protein
MLSVFLGTIVGGIGLNIALFIFHVLYLDTFPQGLLITLGCMMIAVTFAIGSLIRSLPIKMFFSSVSTLIAIMGTWLIHINLADSPVELTPIFRYDYLWPFTQVLFTALGVSLLIGIFGNLINLSIRNEHP